VSAQKKGILAYSAYIPAHRLNRKQIAEYFKIPVMPGERTVAGYDEDSVTMGVEAARSCLQQLGEENDERHKGEAGIGIGMTFFATTSSPYREKQSIPTIIEALDLSKQTQGLEVTSSLRAGTSAMIQANHQAHIQRSLVIAADKRMGGPSGLNEQLIGDGATAFLVGEGDQVVAELVGSISVQAESIGQWRSGDDSFVQSWEERFQAKVIDETVLQGMKQFVQRYPFKAEDITKVIISVPGAKQHLSLAAKLGFTQEQLQDPLLAQVGNSGVAHSLMMFVAALDAAKPKDKLLLIQYSEGIDVLLFEVTDAILNRKHHTSLQAQLEQERHQLSYGEYIKWQGLLTTEPPRRPEVKRPSVPAMYRNYRQNLGLYGSKCTSCGTPQFPKQRICVQCQSKDQMEEVRFVGKKATIATYTIDYLAASQSPPAIVGVVDFEGGGRIMCELTDCKPHEVYMGMQVEMNFRKLYTAGGIHNYFWKAKPLRIKESTESQEQGGA